MIKGHCFKDNIFKFPFLHEIYNIFIQISPKYVHMGPINDMPTLVPIMVWLQKGKKPDIWSNGDVRYEWGIYANMQWNTIPLYICIYTSFNLQD